MNKTKPIIDKKGMAILFISFTMCLDTKMYKCLFSFMFLVCPIKVFKTKTQVVSGR